MAMFSGKQWISNYKQTVSNSDKTGFWPGGAYRDEKPRYTIYRPARVATI
jgi:hypothetical protein